MTTMIGEPYIPGQARGVLSHDSQRPGSILVVDRPDLPAGARPAGIVVVDGAPFSHPMLALLARGVPTVIVTADQAARLTDGETLVLDGTRGTLATADGEAARAEPVMPEQVSTADGVPLQLRASVRDAAGAAQARARGAEAIGLVRTEFLEPLDGRRPDTDFWRAQFAAVADAAAPLTVTFRMLDIAADKRPRWLSERIAPDGLLGRQGVRLYETEPTRSVVDAQILALAELAARHPLKVLLPSVAQPHEARDWCERLRARIPVPIGVMAETPAAALSIVALLELADFVALGTNDLMQCLFGADRDQPAVRRYLDPYSPVLYRFLAEVAQLAGRHVGQVQLCGLLAQLPGVLPVLIGLGYRVFSVDPVSLPWLAERASATRSLRDTKLAADVCHARDSDAVRRRLGLAPAPL